MDPLTQAGEWANWAGDQRCRPARVVAPRSREELAEVVGAAAAAGEKVSVTGSGHSFTEAAMTDQTMLRLDALRGVLDADPASGLVRVGAGTVLADLNEELAGLGLALENLGDIDAQTVAGAISTGTHGTGAGFGNISARVEGVELVLADGSVRDLTAAGDPELLRAARVGVGALGAISAVTLRCFPAFTLRRVDSAHKLDDVLGALRRARRDQRSLRALHLPLLRPGAGAGTQPHRGGAEAEEPHDRLPQRRAAGELGAGGDGGDRQGDPADDPGAGEVRRPGRDRHRQPGPQRPDLRQPAERPLHRDGVRGAARRRADRGAPGDRVGAVEPLSGLLPDRGPGGGRRRRRHQRRPRTRHHLHRRASVPGDGVAPLLRGGRGDHGRLRRPPPLGQAPLPDRGDAGAAVPDVGRLPARPRRARPRPRLLQRVRRPRPRTLPGGISGDPPEPPRCCSAGPPRKPAPPEPQRKVLPSPR